MKMCYKVWSGWTKWLRKAVQEGNAVQCEGIGIFGKNGFIPGEWINSLEMSEGYEGNVDKYLTDHNPLNDIKDERIVKMSIGSIAQACGTSKQKVLDILKDIFIKVVESANNGEEVNLDVKIGNIVIGKDRKIIFKNKSHIITIDPSIEEQRAIPQSNKILTIVPKANGPRSIRSNISDISNFRSVKTPLSMSKCSISSKGKSSRRSVFNSGCSVKANSKISLNKSFVNERKTPYESPDSCRNKLNNSSAIPYPHLAAFIQQNSDHKFGK